jgi:hypothetical protein
LENYEMSKQEETPQTEAAAEKAAVESHDETTVVSAKTEVVESAPVVDQDVAPVDETPEGEVLESTVSPVEDVVTESNAPLENAPENETEDYVHAESLGNEGTEENYDHVDDAEAHSADADLAEGYAPAEEASEPKDQRPVRYALIGLAVGVFVGFCCNFAVTGVQDLIKSSSATAITVAVSDCNLESRDGVSVSDGNKRLLIDTKGSADESGASTQNAVCLVQALQVPEDVLVKLNETKPDGERHKEEWDKHEITWEFSGDKGIKMDILIKS